MTTNFHKREIGYGAFTASDIAKILGAPTQKVYRYIKEYGDARFGEKLFKESYSWKVDGTRVVNFYAFIELSIFLLLRQKYNFKVSEINKVREVLAKAFNTPYPFASRTLYVEQKKIFYKELDQLVNADGTHQFNLDSIVAPFLEKIDFEEDKAVRYFPMGRERNVVVDPTRQYGQPTVSGRGLRVQTLGRMYDSGESKEKIKILYDLSTKELDDALLYYHRRKAA